MSEITGTDLLSAGMPKGPKVGEALKKARLLIYSGHSVKEAIQETVAFYLNQSVTPKLNLRNKPAPLNVALPPPSTGEEAANFSAVMDNMGGILRLPVVTRGAVMPDACPAGQGITVGGVVETYDAVIPSAHSADICCSMNSTFFVSGAPVDAIMDTIQLSTHFGHTHRPFEKRVYASPHYGPGVEAMGDNMFLKGLEDLAIRHFATQGDGNHFASLGDIDVTKELVQELEASVSSGQRVLADKLKPFIGKIVFVLTTHHGSRVLGAEVYKRGQKWAESLTAEIANNVPKWGAWIPMDTPIGKEYWEALEFVKHWTHNNHLAIHQTTLRNLEGTGVEVLGSIFNEHNFVWKLGHTYSHGKGATPAWRGNVEIIPLNMAQPILLVRGKDNQEFCGFAPHGAGRNLSRSKLIAPYKDNRGVSPEVARVLLDDQTAGLDIRWYNGKADISELPFAYKPAEKIKQEIQDYDLATIVGEIQPLGCIMAGDTYRSWERKKNGRSNSEAPAGTSGAAGGDDDAAGADESVR
jgi:RNA-splicing ligase RtcB